MKFDDFSKDYNRIENLFNYTIYEHYLLIDYHKEMENFIDNKLKKLEERIKKAEEESDELDPFDLQEDNLRLNGGYQKTLRSSIFLMFFSFVEDFLYTVCHDLNKTLGITGKEDLNGITPCGNYLTNCINILSGVPEWETIYNRHRLIRNFIVHNNSLFHKTRDEKKFQENEQIFKRMEIELNDIKLKRDKAKVLFEEEIEKCKSGKKEDKNKTKSYRDLNKDLSKLEQKLKKALENLKEAEQDLENMNKLEKLIYEFSDYFNIHSHEEGKIFPAYVILKKEFIFQIINTHQNFFESVCDSLQNYCDKKGLKYKDSISD